MQQTNAIKTLISQSQQGRHVFTLRDLAKLFASDNHRALKASVRRLIENEILIRARRGIYVFAMAQQKGIDTLEHIAKAMRRGEYNYISLESALSEYGAISQIPIDRLTIMTTGRKGEYKTPFGVIEFTHTKRPIKELITNMKNVGRPLRFATKEAAWRDLKRVGRNTHLVDENIIHEN